MARGGGQVIEVIAKVESHDSVPNIEEIVEASDAVMVARGDLGAGPAALSVTPQVFTLAQASDRSVPGLCVGVGGSCCAGM